jgi:cytochrome c biogenesis protein CcmG/thiol:disulfide interchange protein DsbE
MRFKLLFGLFIVAVVILGRGLMLHPNQVPSPLIGKTAPTFSLPQLIDFKKTTTNKDFLVHVTLVNVWATWCAICAEEHELLLLIAKEPNLTMYGFNYKDNPSEAREWLHQHGNPYQIIAVDSEGAVAIDWGVYGTPETFVVDKKGVIRYKQIGALTSENWQQTIKPLIMRLQQEIP